MKVDLKNILIFALLGITMFFAFNWYFSSDVYSYKKRIKELNDQNRLLTKQRDSIKNNLIELRLEFKELEINGEKYLENIDSLSNQIIISKSNARAKEIELNRIKMDIIKKRKELEELLNNPPNRDGIDLLNSLKKHTST
jgi:chromosome segregation ATPase